METRIVRAGVLLLVSTAIAARPVGAQAADPLDSSRLPRIESTEVLSLGGYDERPAFTFSSVPAGAILSPSEIALVDRQANEIRVFGLNGEHRRTFGGTGEGPGEFKFLSALQPLADQRLVAWDVQAKRVSWFSFDGTHARTSALRVEPMAMPWTQFVGAFPDESIVLRSDPSVMALRSEPDGLRREPTYFLRYSPGEPKPDTLCEVLGPEKYLYHQDRSWDLEDRLFEREVVGAVVGETLMCGTTDQLDLRRVDAKGGEQLRLTHLRPERSISPVEIEAERARLIEEAKAQEERRSRAVARALGASSGGNSVVLDRLSKKRAYDSRPSFRSLCVGSGGDLWVEDYPPPTERRVRWILIRGGEPNGWIEVGLDETVLGFGHGLMLKRVQDDMGVQTVVVMRLSGSGA